MYHVAKDSTLSSFTPFLFHRFEALPNDGCKISRHFETSPPRSSAEMIRSTCLLEDTRKVAKSVHGGGDSATKAAESLSRSSEESRVPTAKLKMRKGVLVHAAARASTATPQTSTKLTGRSRGATGGNRAAVYVHNE